MGRGTFLGFVLLLVSLASAPGQAQSTTGLPTFTTIHDSLYDDVKVNDGAILLKLPIRNKAGVIPFSYSLVSNVSYEGFGVSIDQAWTPVTSVGFSPEIQHGWAKTTLNKFCPDGTKTTQLSGYFFIDGFGARHGIGVMRGDTQACLEDDVLSGPADDQSGYAVTIGDKSGVEEPIITDASGNQVTPFKSLVDTNGNQITATQTGPCSPSCMRVWTDATGLPAITETVSLGTITVNGSAVVITTKDVHSWTDAAGNTQSYTFNYSVLNGKTNFGCTSPADLTQQSNRLTSITAPDGNYSISYEPTPNGNGFTNTNPPTYFTGRVSKIVFPSGASIQYSYTGGHNGLNCAIPSASNGLVSITVPVLTRTLTDTNGVAHKWIYDTTQGAGLTVVTDPSGNDTVYTFSLAGSGSSITRLTTETQRQIYQGSHTNANNLLETITKCYNGNTTNCATTAGVNPQITQEDVYTALAGMTQSSHSQTMIDFTTGNVTETKQYDFTGTLISDRVLTYGSYSNGSCSAIPNITNHLCSDTTKDGSGNVLAQANYTYDTHGNLTSTSRLLGGTSFLINSTTYNPNGTLNVATDVNGARTTYSNYACNGSFPQTITGALGLPETMTWDCNGAVVTSVTDANSAKTTSRYANGSTADPFYRPLSMTDPLNNLTNYTYSPTTFESALNFNSTVSTSDSLSKTDGFAHTLLSQKRQGQGSSSFDTVQYGYDLNFRPSSTSLPCSATAGHGCSTPSTTTTYDGAGRPLVVKDGGGGTVTITYTKNDVLQVVGPAPSGENTNQKQLEYDGLGRLTSVCEITGASGSGACGQSVSQTGFLTTYAYDTVTVNSVLYNRTTVKQNAQPNATAQTRTYLYDLLGRLVSEANPENGTTSYVYDTDGTCSSGTFLTGNLVKRTDAVGNVSCYSYDQLHRVLSVTYPSGSYAASTAQKLFVYDAATVNGVAMSNAKGRMAEAYTCTGSCASKITDEGFSYDADGLNTDVYESTPHSGGYYHTTVAYAANGIPQSLAGVPSRATMTYGLDGEGRWSSAVEGTSHIVCDSSCSSTSTTYNAASQPLTINIASGAGDNDTYTYDPNTDRMATYAFTVGSTPATMKGTLTWSQNGTLRTLAITDGFNSGGTQTCNYGTSTTPGYDDLGRLVSVNCGSLWAQTFSYDPFGNLTKSGSLTWNPGYNLSTNRYMLGGTSYDANGNLLKDTFHTYTWDATGHPVTIDSTACGMNGTCLTYDALGRMVEKSFNSTFTEVLYNPLGKAATMSGQTLNLAHMPLPGGATIAENSGNRNFYHKDWLGSVRFASGMGSRTAGIDRAFAPFGETYDGVINGSNDPNFTGDTQDSIAGLYDTPNRELHPNQGRWISPDPAGLGAVDPTNRRVGTDTRMC